MSRIPEAHRNLVVAIMRLLLLITLMAGAMLGTACRLGGDNTLATPKGIDLATQGISIQNINDYTSCESDSDCVIVARDCCGNAAAINSKHLEKWEKHLEAQEEQCAGVMCKEVPPLAQFKGRCHQNKCVVREASCDEEIEDPSVYQVAVLGHPTVVQLNRELNLLKFEAPGVCVMDGKVDVVLRYEMPETYSSYRVIYTADLNLRYHVGEGSLEPGYDPAGPKSVEADAIVAHYRRKIQEVEGNSRVQEFLTKVGWDPLPGRVYLGRWTVRVQGTSGFIVFGHPFDSPLGLVTEYYVPNSVEWESFPEVRLAHQIIKEMLLTKQWAGCSISREGRAYAGTAAHRIGWDEIDDWSLRVYLACGDQWKQAWLRLNADGSYNVLEDR
jgi:hypothetical protein